MSTTIPLSWAGLVVIGEARPDVRAGAGASTGARLAGLLDQRTS